ncbi:MAG: tetratricopeptide repeat protein [Terriglobales bacterium]
MEPAQKNSGFFSSPEQRNVVLGLLLVLATLALYNPVIHHPFVNYDDDRYVTDNAHVRAGLQWDTFKWAFTTYDEANWHPLTWISHAVDCQLFGLNPAGHHYMNIMLHAGNVVLVFWLLWKATGFPGRSFMVAALFALHPINVESVAWVAERKSVLSMLFLLLAVWAYGWYARKPSFGRYAAVAGLFACGLMAKPMVITLPFALLLLDFWPLRRIGNASGIAENGFVTRPLSWLALEKVPLLALSAASAVVTIKAQKAGDAIGSVTQYPIPIRLENAIISYARYLGKAFWPSHLAPMYPLREGSLRGALLWAATLMLVATVAFVVTGKRHRYLIVGWLWFLGTLVPMIGLVQVGTQAMADRYAYLPFLGLFVILVWGVADWAVQRHLPQPSLVVIGAVCLLVAALVTHRQIGFWSDNLALWSHTVAVTSGNFVAEDNLGGALLEQGRQEEAMPHFRAAAAIDPTDAMSRLNIAAYEQRHGNLDAAITQYNQVVHMTRDPRYRATAFNDLGYAYRELGDSARAKQSFIASVALRPRTLRAWFGLGLVAQKSGDYPEAVSYFQRALSIQSWDLGYYMLARALEQSGQKAQAQIAMQEAKRLSTNFGQLQQAADALLAK